MTIFQKLRRPSLIAAAFAALTGQAAAEDGYDLWLRYAPEGVAESVSAPAGLAFACETPGMLLETAADELSRGVQGLFGENLARLEAPAPGALLLASEDCSDRLGGELPDEAAVGEEGYVLRTTEGGGALIAARGDAGVLYGAYALLRRIASGEEMAGLDVTERPGTQLRVLNHWDNLDRTVERGYAGFSLWDWHKLPDYTDPRYTDYARANASIGINGTVLTNVNADATVLTAPYIEKVAALAEVFRPYGLKVYLTARFSAPVEIGGLETADPLDPDVRAFWREKADEIYAAVPDFGGFLVKANSEGQPGPQDYGRTHAEGANMLAEAVAPHGGIVMWRAFVYAAEEPEDRVKQAYTEFTPLDGEFADNVLVQVKNGPLDFQPREPFHPLFGAMPETPLMLELQITKEYLGFATHLAYLGPLWEEVLAADTYAKGEGSPVRAVIDGSLHDYPLTGMAGVSNIGTDRNWSGSIFDQANWYAFGRLAWNPGASAEDIAQEWLALTFSAGEDFRRTALDMMMGSREAVTSYMTPLGLTHLMATGHHYGPGPWVDDLGRADWTPYYYHRATEEAVGFDRTESGSDAVAQYAEPLQARFSEVETTPEELLLWFHRLPWDHEMDSGRTLWEELVATYDQGVAEVEEMQRQWASLEGKIDEERYEQTADFLVIQRNEAQWWRDASLAYWQSVNGLDLPEGVEPPEHSLDYYRALSFPNAPGH